MFYKILIGIKRIIKGYGYIVSKRLKLYGMSNREKFMFVKNNRINIIDGGGGYLVPRHFF